jgi:hypothetical protein
MIKKILLFEHVSNISLSSLGASMACLICDNQHNINIIIEISVNKRVIAAKHIRPNENGVNSHLPYLSYSKPSPYKSSSCLFEHLYIHLILFNLIMIK